MFGRNRLHQLADATELGVDLDSLPRLEVRQRLGVAVVPRQIEATVLFERFLAVLALADAVKDAAVARSRKTDHAEEDAIERAIRDGLVEDLIRVILLVYPLRVLELNPPTETAGGRGRAARDSMIVGLGLAEKFEPNRRTCRCDWPVLPLMWYDIGQGSLWLWLLHMVRTGS